MTLTTILSVVGSVTSQFVMLPWHQGGNILFIIRFIYLSSNKAVYHSHVQKKPMTYYNYSLHQT